MRWPGPRWPSVTDKDVTKVKIIRIFIAIRVFSYLHFILTAFFTPFPDLTLELTSIITD